jgi:hypothetical protein
MSSETGAVPPTEGEVVEGVEEVVVEGGEKISKSELKRRAKAAAVAEEKAAKAAARAEAAAAKGASTGGGGGGPPVEEEILDPSKCVGIDGSMRRGSDGCYRGMVGVGHPGWWGMACSSLCPHLGGSLMDSQGPLYVLLTPTL